MYPIRLIETYPEKVCLSEQVEWQKSMMVSVTEHADHYLIHSLASAYECRKQDLERGVLLTLVQVGWIYKDFFRLIKIIKVEAEDGDGSAVLGYFDLKQRLKTVRLEDIFNHRNASNSQPNENKSQCSCLNEENADEDTSTAENCKVSNLAPDSNKRETKKTSSGQSDYQLRMNCSYDELNNLCSCPDESIPDSDFFSVFLPARSDILFLNLGTGQTSATPSQNFMLDWGPNQER